ncbi:MAG: ATP-binding cassette domain-containing protein [Deltaproteobacteria bacterium]|nr:ATP-binding cassette domain-containing protein [Deltaproteobacteria bacterium]MBW2151500.1 ATP-binding cassette domain-containing protein [Deltaproteobacteria bacterium]
MIYAENLTKSFAGHTLFENVSFKLNPRERLGLVGRNGHGKTTLFRIIVGEEDPDSGCIHIPKNYRIGYVRQDLNFTEETILKEGMKGLSEHNREQYWKVEQILAGLGFSNKDMNRPPQHFSGGFQVRLNLAKVLVSDPDLLLLDEPTNYLDITSIRWVKRYLQTWPRELMLITHDRSLMDAVVTHTMGIHRKKLRKVAGTTEKYYHQIAQEEEIYEKTRLKDERRRKEVEQFVNRFRAKARLANLVQSRIKMIEKTAKVKKLERIRKLDFSFICAPFSGKYMLEVSELSFFYHPEKQLISRLSISVKTGERIGVIGKNGKGKTTLLRLIAGHIAPQEGTITFRSGVIPGFFEQTNIQSLVNSRTVEEEIQFSNPSLNRQTVRSICGSMMFSGDEALKKIGVLSGGEKSRVLLGKLLVTPINLLLLDEPTHHLDMDCCDALLSAVDNFPGAVVIVTHNEMFLHALAERLIVFESDTPYVFDGSYQRFLEKGGWQIERQVRGPNGKASAEVQHRSRLTKKELRKRRSEIISHRAKVLQPIERRIEQIENDIEMQEKSLHELNKAMQLAAQSQDGKRIPEISQSIHHCQSAIDRYFQELETLTEDLEKQQRLFEKKLLEINRMEDAL